MAVACGDSKSLSRASGVGPKLDVYKRQPLEYGAVVTKAEEDFSRRLEIIYDRIYEISTRWQPQALSIEKLYFQNNQKTAIGVAEARGVILLAVKKAGIPIFEYTPLQVKQAVTGYGPVSYTHLGGKLYNYRKSRL